jgi:hypothetical protein
MKAARIRPSARSRSRRVRWSDGWASPTFDPAGAGSFIFILTPASAAAQHGPWAEAVFQLGQDKQAYCSLLAS